MVTYTGNRISVSVLAWACLAMGTVAVAPGQGVLVVEDAGQSVRLPRPLPASAPADWTYRIKELSVHARLRDQAAQVRVSQTFVNPGSVTMEVAFVFPLPYDGAIERLTLMVDGRELPARLLPADQARAMYEEIVRKNRDPALLEWMGTGLFKTSVFPVPPGAERRVTLEYTQVCRMDSGLTEFLFPLSTAKYTAAPVEQVDLTLSLESQIAIKNIYSPTHQVTIERADPRHAVVKFSAANQTPRDDFRVLFDVDAGALGATVMSYRPDDKDDGYFLLLANPQVAPGSAAAAKTVVFVVDRSGSMSGDKIEQAKGALRFVLNNLHAGDLFNIVAYDSAVELFRPELQKFDDATRAAALGFVDGLFAGGATNIDAALTSALGQLVDSARPNYVIFLTDGLPTEGEQNESRIVVQSESSNKVRARVFPFGVGYDVNSRLLDKLARANHGQTSFVRPNENIEDQVSRLYRRIESPVLTDVQLNFALDGGEGAPVNRLYPSGTFDLFAGEQLVVAGRYRRHGAAKLTVSGSAGGQTQTFEFPVNLVEHSADSSFGFVEKVWATRRVGEIIDQLDLKGRNEELVKELVELATRHGILTPYTSFLADETTDLADVRANTATAGVAVRQLDEVAGQRSFYQRAAKAALQNAESAMPALPAAGSGGGLPGEVDAPALSASVATSLQNIGQKTFYRRDNQWFDSTVTEAQRQRAVRVVQYSREYFDLAALNGKELAKYLVFDEPVLVNLRGQCYQIEPPASSM